MRIFSKAFRLSKALLALGLVSSALPASAETRDVAPNRASPIGFYYTYSKDNCYSGAKPRFKVLREGEHGTVTAKWQAITIQDPGKCHGRRMFGMLIIYSPAKGFHGPDKVKVAMSSARYAGGADGGLTNIVSFDIKVH